MRFVVNMSSVAAHPTGLGSYATRVCAHLTDRYKATVLAPPHLALPPGTGRIATPATVAIGGGGRSALARVATLARRQIFYLRGPIRPDDLVYSPTHHGFFNSRNQIITIHDLIGLHYPGNFPRQTRYFRSVMPRLIARSRAVFVVSEATRGDVIRFFGTDPGKVFVVPNAIAAPAPSGDGVKEDYLLIVGAHLPHKNVEEVLHRSALWAGQYTLKIVGAAGAYGAGLRQLVEQLRLADRVEFLPFVGEGELDRLYRRAAALLYPSKMEGFGLPPLEALARGTVPIVSDIPVHREVLGDAARFVTLGDERSWARALAEAGVVPSAAARDVLARYAPAAVGARLDAALLAVAPELAALRR